LKKITAVVLKLSELMDIVSGIMPWRVMKSQGIEEVRAKSSNFVGGHWSQKNSMYY